MEVNGQLHAPAALPPVKRAPIPVLQEAGLAPEPVWMLWRREKSLCFWQESNPVSSVVQAHRLVAIPTVQFWLPFTTSVSNFPLASRTGYSVKRLPEIHSHIYNTGLWLF
jgi:hypothetical protein